VLDLTTALMSENNITQNDIQYMEAKAIFVQLVRSLPYFAKKTLDLNRIAEAAATSKDAQMVRKGIKVQDMLKELEEANVIDRKDNYALLAQEIKQELVHLGDLKDRVMQESSSLESVYQTILDHNNYLKSQLESYKAYLQNVRIQSGGGEKGGKKSVGIGVEVENSGKNSKSKASKQQVLGPYKFTHQQLEKDGVIAVTNVPDSRQVVVIVYGQKRITVINAFCNNNRKGNIFFTISCPMPGTFIIELHYKGRDKPILEMDLKLDDLLEKVKACATDISYSHFCYLTILYSNKTISKYWIWNTCSSA
jgi:Ras GTPase-activating-like protein IQGAP2/3